jgi:diguanylate cyclase (GGDEF)-like protein
MHDVQTITARELKREQAIVRSGAFLIQIAPSGPHLGARYCLAQAPLVVGRSSDAGIRVEDALSSRQHARIEAAADGYQVIDLNSTNGTFVNEHRVALRMLEDGDYVRVGNHVFRYLAASNVELAYHEELQQLSTIDPLTLIPNRSWFERTLAQEVALAARCQRSLALLLVDVDRFKSINDQLGHLAGDAVLREVAGRIEVSVRRGDVLARFGGDEFGLLLPGTTLPKALELGQRICRAVTARPISHGQTCTAVSISVGVAVTSAQPESPEKLITRADEKLYEAKRSGRNCVAGG